MENELEKLKNEQEQEYYKQKQSLEDTKVFYDTTGDNKYQQQRISHNGFDSIESFRKGINEVKNEIKDCDILLKDVQKELKEIIMDLDLYKNHPEIALPGETEKLDNKYKSLLDKKESILKRKEKEEKNLEVLNEAKKRFMKNLKETHKNEIKEKMKYIDEYARLEQEMKNLYAKIYNGTAKNYEKERYEAIKNEILPELLEKINHNKINHDNNDSDIENANTENNQENDLEKEKNSIESSSTNDLENQDIEKSKEEEQYNQNNDLEPEGRKKVSSISKAGQWLKSKISNKKVAAILAIAGSIAALAFLAPAVLAGVAGGYAINEFRKGMKGK